MIGLWQVEMKPIAAKIIMVYFFLHKNITLKENDAHSAIQFFFFFSLVLREMESLEKKKTC